jgi:hypothetical protein
MCMSSLRTDDFRWWYRAGASRRHDVFRSPRLAPSAWVYLLGVGLLATAWATSDVHAQAAAASVHRYPPDPSRTRSVLDNSAAIFEARVDDVRYTYDVHTGPRMAVDLAVTNLIAGALASDHVTIPMFGGPIPDGRFMSMSFSVKFAPGRHYILCLYNQPWFYTPLTAEALRVLSVNGREVLVSQSGFAVIGLNPQGLHYSKVRLYGGEDPSNLRTATKMRSKMRRPKRRPVRSIARI